MKMSLGSTLASLLLMMFWSFSSMALLDDTPIEGDEVALVNCSVKICFLKKNDRYVPALQSEVSATEMDLCHNSTSSPEHRWLPKTVPAASESQAIKEFESEFNVEFNDLIKSEMGCSGVANNQPEVPVEPFVTLYTSNSCGDSYFADIDSQTNCSTLTNRLGSVWIRGVRVAGGRCMNIEDIDTKKGCEKFKNLKRELPE